MCIVLLSSSLTQVRGFRATGMTCQQPTAILTWSPESWQAESSVATTNTLLVQRRTCLRWRNGYVDLKFGHLDAH